MNSKPYIGITGPVSVKETKQICKEFSKAKYNMFNPHVPMLGFLVSHKTLNRVELKNRRYPPIDLIPELLEATNNEVLTMIHYNSREIDTLSNQVSKIFEGIYESNLCKAIQLNIVWPDLNQISKIKEKYPEMEIVFQASHKAMEEKNPFQIVKGIKNYGDSINYVLIDPSGGRGMPFVIASSVAIYSELREQCPNLTVGFAGGFKGDNVGGRLIDLIRKTKETNFCIDAEGGLRDRITSAYGDDILNIEKVNDYLKTASKIIK